MAHLLSFLSIVFFAFYAASGLVAGAYIFQDIWPVSYHWALMITAITMMIYTSVGGYLAINWIDAFQASLIFLALLIVPVMVFSHLHGGQQMLHAMSAHRAKNYLSMIHHVSVVLILSWLAWGFGYFGQPHILTRFMSSKSTQSIHQGRRICMAWMIFSLSGAVAAGFLGAIYFGSHTLGNPENVFLQLSAHLLPTIITGLLYAAVLSAVMSVISAQLLSAATSLTKDMIMPWQSVSIDEQKNMMFLNRLSVFLIGVLSLLIAYHPNQNILKLVGFAWACLGSSFGPLLLLSLYWRRVSYVGAMAGVLVGAFTSSFWPLLYRFGGLFHLYAMIPGFICSTLSIIVVSWCCRSAHDDVVTERFNSVLGQLRKSV